MPRLPWLTFLLLLPAIALLHPPLATDMQYDRSLMHGTDLLRLLTCQWTHWSLDHFVWDAIVFVVLGMMIESRSRRALGMVVGTSAIVVPLAVHAFCPGITHFRGLSGSDTALVGYLIGSSLMAATCERQRGGIAFYAAAGLLVIGKTVVEIATDQPIFADGGTFVVVPVAHAVGFACGIVVAVLDGAGRVGGSRRSDIIARPTRGTG